MISTIMKAIFKYLALIGGASLVIMLFVLWWNTEHVGQELDRYRNVPVYDNGILFFRSYGCHYTTDGEYYYGQKWQCVEYIKRFYYKVKGHSMPDVWGDAKDFFDPELPDGKFNQRRGLQQYQNGSTTPPARDDILVFRDTTYGHVGIITNVTEDTVEIIQQNIFGKPRQTFQLHIEKGRYTITKPRKVAGWLRTPTR